MPLDRVETVSVGKSPNPAWLFFKRWLANPLTMASITPSSPSLARAIAGRAYRADDEVIVEFGGGTGAITRGLLETGVPASRLYTVEIDPELSQFLRRQFPEVNLLEGDVRHVSSMLPSQLIGKVGTVVVGIPMVLLPPEMQQEIVNEIFKIMPEGRFFLAYTYSAGAPLKYKDLGLEAKRVAFTLANLPPASVWAFRKASN
jgi:phosphatidylethanolamine/phosphatidyl-N-methylethanolamine N-methyltransferase